MTVAETETLNPAISYFRERGVTAHPFVVQAFAAGRGWVALPREPLSPQVVRLLRQQGYTVVGLHADHHVADFTLSEFWCERVGLGQWRGSGQ